MTILFCRKAWRLFFVSLLWLLVVTPAGSAFTTLDGAFGHRLHSTQLSPAPSCRIHQIQHRFKTTDFHPFQFARKRVIAQPLSAKKKDDLFDARTTFALIGGQSLLIAGAAVAAFFVGTPNWGFGPGISFDFQSIRTGSLLALPLGAFAAGLDLIEDRFPALKDVTTATQRSVLALLGGTWKPQIALITALALGMAAGFGEEMLFRGILQYELGSRFGQVIAVGLSSIIFGALHAVTPMYAALATIASIYFGGVYLMTGNLAVAIACHAVYDIWALLFAHWTVSQLTDKERKALAMWEGPKGSPIM